MQWNSSCTVILVNYFKGILMILIIFCCFLWLTPLCLKFGIGKIYALLGWQICPTYLESQKLETFIMCMIFIVIPLYTVGTATSASNSLLILKTKTGYGRKEKPLWLSDKGCQHCQRTILFCRFYLFLSLSIMHLWQIQQIQY